MISPIFIQTRDENKIEKKKSHSLTSITTKNASHKKVSKLLCLANLVLKLFFSTFLVFIKYNAISGLLKPSLKTFG